MNLSVWYDIPNHLTGSLVDIPVLYLNQIFHITQIKVFRYIYSLLGHIYQGNPSVGTIWWRIIHCNYPRYPTYTIVPYFPWYYFIYHSAVPFITQFPNDTLNWVLVVTVCLTDAVINALPVGLLFSVIPLHAWYLDPLKVIFWGVTTSWQKKIKSDQALIL